MVGACPHRAPFGWGEYFVERGVPPPGKQTKQSNIYIIKDFRFETNSGIGTFASGKFRFNEQLDSIHTWKIRRVLSERV